ncbi:MAG: tRNA (adenosine(37)-N6)-threonylcarbamoyltransferase complex transferase subunit TsaD [Defluviitaleaceae bacterium]|nr:tRNA (adenosine(37)-N6)-threonylcarbamoyltransferase complex transferase subunit TsaD [Defluviitaleaceae bacterium]
MIILGIETSCDETAAAVIEGGRRVLSNIIASQTELHSPFGGVVPEIAARGHIEAIRYIVDSALDEATVNLSDIDGYAVANGPGLAGALLVGMNYGKALAYANKKPLVGVQHIEGHVCANYLDSGLEPPFLCLVVSGGHTIILGVDDYDSYRIIGSTRDDAAGEAFDKVGRLLGLPFPGGPEIDKLARTGQPDAYTFPRAKVDGFDFSFSGLKTAARDVVGRVEKDAVLPDIAASFQQAVVDVLVGKTIKACEDLGYTQVALAGGVACNHGLRIAMQDTCNAKGLPLFMPKPIYCTDNAAMIASRGYFAIAGGRADGLELNAFPQKMT